MKVPVTYPLDVVTACRARDLPILKLVAMQLRICLPIGKLWVITAQKNFKRFKKVLGDGVYLLDEDTLIPKMTISKLKTLPVPSFPKGAGWYFQQFLKYSFAFREIEKDFYLIWDADTIPLRHINFFDEQGRMLLTRAKEYNAPYFETYRRLIGEDACYEFSFIAQHMIIQKSVLREMLHHIEQQVPGPENWAWKIMKSLPQKGYNLFSEYETYGHYIKKHYSERIYIRDLPWFRDGYKISKFPNEKVLNKLAINYYFVAFEVSLSLFRRLYSKVLFSEE